jgi:hypothetical protein
MSAQLPSASVASAVTRASFESAAPGQWQQEQPGYPDYSLPSDEDAEVTSTLLQAAALAAADAEVSNSNGDDEKSPSVLSRDMAFEQMELELASEQIAM